MYILDADFHALHFLEKSESLLFLVCRFYFLSVNYVVNRRFYLEVKQCDILGQ